MPIEPPAGADRAPPSARLSLCGHARAHRRPWSGRWPRGSTMSPSRLRPPAPCSSTGSRSASAAPTGRSCAASTAGRRRARSGSCSATSRWAACCRRPPARASRRATSSSASCGGPTRCRARPARRGSGTSAPTASTPSAASSRCTATARSAGASSPSSRSGSTRGSRMSACCSSRRAWWPRRGSRSSASARGRRSSPAGCSSPAPARSACWARCWRSSAATRSTCSTRSPTGPSPSFVRRLGGTYHAGDASAAGQVDIVLEATGAPGRGRPGARAPRNGIVCLTGVSSGGRPLDFDIGGFNRDVVLENDVVFGTVNANRRHYEAAAEALAAADRDWLRGLITRRVPLERWEEALERRPDDVKVVVELVALGQHEAVVRAAGAGREDRVGAGRQVVQPDVGRRRADAVDDRAVVDAAVAVGAPATPPGSAPGSSRRACRSRSSGRTRSGSSSRCAPTPARRA